MADSITGQRIATVTEQRIASVGGQRGGPAAERRTDAATAAAAPYDETPELDLTHAQWQSSSRQGVGHVQIAFVEGFIAMRDRRKPDGPALIFTPAEWRAFVLGARDGEFDLT